MQWLGMNGNPGVKPTISRIDYRQNTDKQLLINFVNRDSDPILLYYTVVWKLGSAAGLSGWMTVTEWTLISTWIKSTWNHMETHAPNHYDGTVPQLRRERWPKRSSLTVLIGVHYILLHCNYSTIYLWIIYYKVYITHFITTIHWEHWSYHHQSLSQLGTRLAQVVCCRSA